MSRQSINIKPKTFNADKLVVSEPIEIKKGNRKMKLSEISYLNDNNESCDLLISLPKVQTWGPYPQYTFNTTNKDPQNICGYTISYSNDETNKLFKKFKKFALKN